MSLFSKKKSKRTENSEAKMSFENNEKYKFNWGRETHGVKTVNNLTILISYIIQLIELMWKEKFKFPVNSSLI